MLWWSPLDVSTGGGPIPVPLVGGPPSPSRQNPSSEGTLDQAARQEVTSYTPPLNRQTGVKTLPSRNFVGGKNDPGTKRLISLVNCRH